MGKFSEYIKEALYVIYDKEQEKDRSFVSVDTLIDAGKKPLTEFSYVVREGDGY